MFLWLLGNILASLAVVFLFHYAYKQLQDSFTTPETVTVAAQAQPHAGVGATRPVAAATGESEPGPDMASILRSHVQGLNNSSNAAQSGPDSTDIECLPKRE